MFHPHPARAKNLTDKRGENTPLKPSTAFTTYAKNSAATRARLKNGTSLHTTLAAGLSHILINNLDDLEILRKDQADIYARIIDFADNVDALAQYTAEAVAEQACMGIVQTTIFNMLRNLSAHYLDLTQIDQYKTIIDVQANLLVTISPMIGHDLTKDAQEKLTELRQIYTHWETALSGINYALAELSDTEDEFLDQTLSSTFGSYGMVGTPDNPVISILNKIRTHSETVFNETRKAEILWDVMEEKLWHYKNAIKTMTASISPADKHHSLQP